jgi:peptidoglycan/LPS O-acetylase OafA/YrhL
MASDRRTELDGLRALAILGVMYTHFVNDDSVLGTLGVYLFFVLSGYLITGILLRCKDLIEAKKATLGGTLKTFYIRRSLRIVPVYYLCLFILLIAGSHEVREQIWWHVTFNSNFLFSLVPFTDLTAHFWTLAVEEQFYLVWPAIILLAPKRYLLPILIVLIVSAPVYRLLVGTVFGFSKNASGIITIACLDCLATGALLAYVNGRGWTHAALLKVGFWSLPIPVLLATFGSFHNDFFDEIARTLCAFAFAWIVAYSSTTWLPGRLLRMRVFVTVGIVSYGAYIFHLPVRRLVIMLYSNTTGQELDYGPRLFIFGAAVTLAIAAIFWKLFEQPINSLKLYWPYEAR